MKYSKEDPKKKRVGPDSNVKDLPPDKRLQFIRAYIASKAAEEGLGGVADEELRRRPAGLKGRALDNETMASGSLYNPSNNAVRMLDDYNSALSQQIGMKIGASKDLDDEIDAAGGIAKYASGLGMNYDNLRNNIVAQYYRIKNRGAKPDNTDAYINR